VLTLILGVLTTLNDTLKVMSILSFSHYMGPWLLPPGLNLLLIFIGWAIGYYFRLLGKLCIMLGVISLWLFSTPMVAYHFIDSLQNQWPLLSAKETSASWPNTAIVVLGGGDTIQAEYGYQQAPSNVTLRRLNYAAYLHDNMHLPVITSGGKTRGALKSEAELMANYLKERHIKVDIIENNSMTTAEESRYILPILAQHHFEKIILVTNAWHMPRSVYIFKCAGIDVVPAPMGFYIYAPGHALISWLPNMQALLVSSTALHEYIGLLWYRFYYTCKA